MVVSLVYSDVLVTLKHHEIRQHSRTLSTRPSPRPRTIEIVLEDPRGQGHVIEDSITATDTCSEYILPAYTSDSFIFTCSDGSGSRHIFTGQPQHAQYQFFISFTFAIFSLGLFCGHKLCHSHSQWIIPIPVSTPIRSPRAIPVSKSRASTVRPM